LFSLLGTTYGGDGKSNFALPDIRGSAVMHPGQGPGLSLHDLGETGGSDAITLLDSELPAHTHAMGVFNLLAANSNVPSAQVVYSKAAAGGQVYQTTTNSNLTQMSPSTLAPAGGSLPHNNLMPYLTLNFCIALQGVFPPRS
jgi:microcystin-dependent protein